ncbi:hypothetical protein N8Z74_00655 [Schleiferiaceae bacterium]|nr:hypothetical protein [Schleiferiaceae bacterium]
MKALVSFAVYILSYGTILGQEIKSVSYKPETATSPDVYFSAGLTQPMLQSFFLKNNTLFKNKPLLYLDYHYDRFYFPLYFGVLQSDITLMPGLGFDFVNKQYDPLSFSFGTEINAGIRSSKANCYGNSVLLHSTVAYSKFLLSLKWGFNSDKMDFYLDGVPTDPNLTTDPLIRRTSYGYYQLYLALSYEI